VDPRLPLLVIEPSTQPPGSHPYEVYLSQLQGESTRTIQSCLDRMARVLAGLPHSPAEPNEIDGSWVPWWELRYEGTSALRTVMLEQTGPDGTSWSASHINKHLSALRGVLKESWRLDLMSAEDYHRAADIKQVTAKREPAGRDVAEDELDALLAACDDTALGIRDGAVIATVYATGLRRAEAAALTMASYSTVTQSLRVLGKGNKERIVPVSLSALPWLNEWFKIRGSKPGPLFCPLSPKGTVVYRHMTPQTIAALLERRRLQAGLALKVNPHDLRRTLIGDLLDDGVDLVTAQAIAGHAHPGTTSKYDRRGLDTRRDAVDGLRLRRPGQD
jgi:site-specific recombinase XerD